METTDRTPVLVLGDSHATVFSSDEMVRAFPAYAFTVQAVGGATVSGLQNPNNVTQSMPVFRQALSTTDARLVIVLLGEVDTGFVIWHRAQRHGASVEDMLGQALTSYRTFLDEVALIAPPICVSAPLPTIPDNCLWGEVANARREVTATQAERTVLTRRFNRAMESFCVARGYGSIMLDDMSQGPGGVVRHELLNADPADHHYATGAYVEMLRPRLSRVLPQQSPDVS